MSEPAVAPPLPTSADPSYGINGHVLISDRLGSGDASLDQCWVGFGRRDKWDAFVRMGESGQRIGGFLLASWICGRMVASPSHPLGFYFDPTTTFAGEVVAEVLQTSIDYLKLNPEAAERDQPGAWCINRNIEQIVPGGS